MVEKKLVLTIDATGMKRGADEATTSIRRIETASSAAARIIDESERSVDRMWKEIEKDEKRRAASLAESSRLMQRSNDDLKKSLTSVGGVAEVVERKFAVLGKAMIGFAAADFGAKVFGFTSAMDLLGSATTDAANALRDALGITAFAKRMEIERKQVEDAADAWKVLAKAREAADDALYPGYRIPGQTRRLEVSTGSSPYLAPRRALEGGELSLRRGRADLSGVSLKDENRLIDELQKLPEQFDRIFDKTQAKIDALGRGFDVRFGAGGKVVGSEMIVSQGQREVDALWTSFLAQVDEARSQEARSVRVHQEHVDVLKDLQEKESALVEARTALADIPIARGLFGPTEGESSRFGLASGYTGNPWAGVGFPPYNGDRRGSIAASRGGRAQAGLEGYLYELESSRYTLPGDEQLPASNAYREVMSRDREARIAQQKSIEDILTGGKFGFSLDDGDQVAQLSRSLGEDVASGLGEGLMTGDWKSAGQSVVLSLQQSLMEQLIAEPFADFAATAVSKLLGSASSVGLNGAAARGLAYDRSGSVIPMAYGGIFDGPQLVGGAGGQRYLVGEAGEEAAMPLTRTRSGHLGVRSVGSSPINVTVHVNGGGNPEATGRAVARSVRQVMQDVRRG